MKKLKLGKQTIMNLTPIQAEQVKGGKILLQEDLQLLTAGSRCSAGCTDGCPSFLETAYNCTEYRCTHDCAWK